MEVRHMQKVIQNWARDSHMAPTEFLPEHVYVFCKSKSIANAVTQLSFRGLFLPFSCHKKAPCYFKLELNFREIKSGGEEREKEKKKGKGLSCFQGQAILFINTGQLFYFQRLKVLRAWDRLWPCQNAQSCITSLRWGQIILSGFYKPISCLLFSSVPCFPHSICTFYHCSRQ